MGVRTTMIIWTACLSTVACGGSANDERLGETSNAATADFFLKIGGVEGESKSGGNGTMLSWAVHPDGSATGSLALECDEKNACSTAEVSGALLSAENAVHTSVWRLSGLEATVEPFVVRAAHDDPNLVWMSTIGAAGTPWTQAAPALLASCTIASDCDATGLPSGWICVPVCTYGTKIP